MKKILVVPKHINQVSKLLDTDVFGLILPMKGLSVNSEYFFSMEEIEKIVRENSHKEICVLLNKIMMNEDLIFLEEVLKKLQTLKISKILFYDLAVLNICKRLHIDIDLVIFQDHLNASIATNLFYQKRGVNYSVITNDITIDEINDISKYQKLMMVCYGYLPMFYSRRYLISNYLTFLGKEKIGHEYFIQEMKDGVEKYRIVEEESGTTIYTKEPINLLNSLDDLSIEYVILNENYLDEKEFFLMLNKYLNSEKDDNQYYEGFLRKKTVYKVEDYE